LDPQAAPKLVIGGLPQSRLPILLALLGLSAGLVVAALAVQRRAQALARLRADFVSRVSHELRTPLTQIRMFAETLLLGRVRSDSERRRSLKIIDKEARRLSHLVDNVLLFSRGERRRLRLTPRPLDLAALVRSLLIEFAPPAHSSRIRLAATPPDPSMARADPDAVRQILLNLLDNAVKYGPAGQEIQVGLRRVDSALQVWVEDQGPGIPRAERSRVWQSFERLDRDRDSAVGGAGIGLAVVRELAELQGGRAWVEDGQRGGARFVVELPASSGENL
jgi:signal transduction histidine kinase